MTTTSPDPIPNRTDPDNTATNGPQTMSEASEFVSEETIDRPRSQAPEPYDAVILSSFGGPEGQEDVIPFLRNVTAGRGIPDERLEEVATHYRANGGVSPINEQNRNLLQALREELGRSGPDVPVLWANRNWEPYVEDVVQQAYDKGFRKLLVLATSAYPGYSSCRQYREDYGMALERLGLDGELQIDKIRQHYDAPGFIESFVEGLVRGLREVKDKVRSATEHAAGNGRVRIVFCTHSVPTSAANEAGPRGVGYEGGSAYVEKHLQAARAVLRGVEETDPELLGDCDWELAYQSRSGSPSTPWLEPDINDALEALRGTVDGVVMVPLGFVSDHMEVAWDLDTEAMETCENLGFQAVRIPTPGTHPAYVRSLRDLIAERCSATAPSTDPKTLDSLRRSACGGKGWFDRCDPDCCLPVRAARTKPVIADQPVAAAQDSGAA